MKHLSYCSVLGLAVAMAWMGSTAEAQPFPNYGPYSQPGSNPYARPILSPYLNLLRGGNPAANYYMGVLPERDRRRNESILGQEVIDLERREALTTNRQPEMDELLPTLPSTGHATAFFNYTPYYTFGGTVPATVPPAGARAGASSSGSSSGTRRSTR